MEGVADGTVKLGALPMKPDRVFNNLEPEFTVSSPVTRQKAAAAKQFIENHYKNYLQGLQDRKERSFFKEFSWRVEAMCFLVDFCLTLLLFLTFSGDGRCRGRLKKHRYRVMSKRRCLGIWRRGRLSI